MTSTRLAALDVFRGLTMAGMILVSNPGGPVSYPPLEHAAWNGWTPTDLVFPTFAFAIGVALVYSLAARAQRTAWPGRSAFDWITTALLIIKFALKIGGQTGWFSHAATPALGGYDIVLLVMLLLLIALPLVEKRAMQRGSAVAWQVVHHGFLLFALGFVWSFDVNNPAGFRLFAVLQRLGIVYLATGLIVLSSRRHAQIAWLTGLLALYWIVMKVVPVPGFGAGVLTMEGNFAGYVDRVVLGRAHMYQPQPLPYWDPEGILGSIPAIATGLLGALAGGWIREEKPLTEKIAALCVVGSLMLVVGQLLDPWFPINKNLWSPTFVLFVGGFDFIALAIGLWFIDLKGVRKPFYPFLVLGSNSILIYLLSGTVMHYLGEISGGRVDGHGISLREAAYHYGFASWLSPMNASAAMALVYVALWTGVAAILYRRKILIKI